MSRIGKQIIEIPDSTTVTFDNKTGTCVVKGPHGELERVFRDEIEISVSEKEITFTPRNNDIFSRSLWGTYASHVSNMIQGVTEQFEKKLSVEGVGYRVEVSGNELVLTVGFSHPVRIEIPNDLSVTVEKNVISIKGSDKESVGGFAARVRGVKKPEPYKGKGIRYEGEVVKQKQGKKSV